MSVSTSSGRHFYRRHLRFKMVMPEMTSSRTWGEFFDPYCGGGGKWRPFRFRSPSWMTSNWKWGHPRWRPEAEGPPFSSTSTIGIEKLALYYWQYSQNDRRLIIYTKPHYTFLRHAHMKSEECYVTRWIGDKCIKAYPLDKKALLHETFNITCK